MKISMNLEDFKIKFSHDLYKYLSENLLLQADCFFSEFSIQEKFKSDELLEYMLSTVESGKMFRPYLVYVMAKDLDYEDCINYCIAIELLHFFALIHDDVMDQSLYRRGQKTLHLKYSELISNINLSLEKQTHIANSMAILAGDYVFSICEGAFEEKTNKIDSLLHTEARKAFQKLKAEVILGQMLDVELDLLVNPDKDLILQKTYLKTANYSISRPMQIGSIISGNSDQTDFCLEFGLYLGLAFQIQDDYLSLTQEKEVTGKEIYSDIIDGKHTLATWYIRNQLNKNQKTIFETEFINNKNLDPSKLKSFLEKNGVFEYLQKNIDEYYAKASEVAENNSELELIELVKILKNRKK